MAIASSDLAVAMGCALILLAVIIAVANLIHWFGRQQAKKRAAGKPTEICDLIVPFEHFILLRILLDKDDHASLSSFQFLMWTLLISFLYSTLWFLQFLARVPGAPPEIDPNLMILMGISIAVPLSSRAIEVYKQIRPRREGEEYHPPDYASMLEEEGRPSLLRFQMFLWTLAALVIYTAWFISGALGPDATVGVYALPGINETFLFLMGLSQTGYLGSKAFGGTVESTEPGTKKKAGRQLPTTTRFSEDQLRVPVPAGILIREIIPRDTIRSNELVTILGSGFGGTKDTIIIGQDRIDPMTITKWHDDRIEFALPVIVKPGVHPFTILAGGNSTSGQITVSTPPLRRGFNNVDADIISEIWIDDPSMKGYRCPPIGHFIPNKTYHFFFEFRVPEGTPQWGMTQFHARFFVDGKEAAEQSFMPGHMNGKNYGVFDYLFIENRSYLIEIKGEGAPKTMKVDVQPGYD